MEEAQIKTVAQKMIKALYPVKEKGAKTIWVANNFFWTVGFSKIKNAW